MQAMFGQERLQQERRIEIIFRAVTEIADDSEVRTLVMPRHLQIFFGDKEFYLAEEIVITARCNFVLLEKFSVITAVRHQAQKFPQARVRTVEFVNWLSCFAHAVSLATFTGFLKLIVSALSGIILLKSVWR